jgi:hypothetical protein
VAVVGDELKVLDGGDVYYLEDCRDRVVATFFRDGSAGWWKGTDIAHRQRRLWIPPDAPDAHLIVAKRMART